MWPELCVESEYAMIQLEVSVNGSVLCPVGNEQNLKDVSVLQMLSLCAGSANALLHLHEMIYCPPSTGEDLAPQLRAALQNPERPESVHSVVRIDHQQLQAGDQITIRLVDIPASPPLPDPDATPDSK